MNNAFVWMHGRDMSEQVSSDQEVFCVPKAMGEPPFNVSYLRLHGNETSQSEVIVPGSRLSAALAKFGLVYVFWLKEHRADWDSLPGGSILPAPNPSLPDGVMTIGWPASNGASVVLARTSAPDDNGFRYAAHCWRLPKMPTSICTITVADSKTGLDHYRPLAGIPDDVYGWRQNEPVPHAFTEIALSGRELLAALKSDPQSP